MENGDRINFKRLRRENDIRTPSAHDTRANMIMEEEVVPVSIPFPVGWIGEKDCLVNMDPFHVNVTFANGEYPGHGNESTLREFRNYSIQINQSFKKMDGKGRYAFHRMYRKMGIASTYSQMVLGHSTSFYSTLIQTLEGLGPLKKRIFDVKKKSSMLLVNDTSNAFTLGSLLLAKYMKVDFNWTSIISGLFKEDVVRNYQNINDLANFLHPDRVHRCMLDEDNITEETNRVIECVQKDPGYSIIIADVTGDHVLENHENVTRFEGTKWLFLTRHLIQKKLSVNGNAILRLQLRPLINKSFLRLLIDVSRDFASHRWILPVGGRDTGVIFLALQDYFGKEDGSSNELFNVWPVPLSISMNAEEEDFIHNLNKILKVTVPPFTDFVDSTLLMMHSEEQLLHNCMIELERRRKRVLDNLGVFVKMYLDKDAIKEFVDGGKDAALIFNWFHHRSMSIDNGMDLFQTNLKDQVGLFVNIHGARKLAEEGSIREALTMIRALSRECSDAWERNNPQFLALPWPIVLVSDWLRYPFSSRPLEVIRNSRWCISGLVPIRGTLKDILTPHAGTICQNLGNSQCSLCNTGDAIKSFCNSKKIYPFNNFDENKLHRLCLKVDLKDFVTMNDKEQCYARIRKVMDHFLKLGEGESMYICNPSLLTRLDVGLIYLLASSFYKTILISSVEPSPTFGVLFHKLYRRYNTERITDHVNNSMDLGRSELVPEDELNKFFGTHLLHAMNVSLLRNWIKAVYRDLEEAGVF